MTFRIPKGWHYGLPLFTWLWWNKKVFTWKVQFTDSCRYDLQSDDQLDTNKLCGIGYFPGFHHVDSARFGWQYDRELERIMLSAYCYVNKERVILPITTIPLKKAYLIQLTINNGSYFFKVIDESGNKLGGTGIAFSHKNKLQYLLLPYFGGNRKAPHSMKIQLKRI